MATTIEIPLELSVVNPTNANAYWTLQNGPLWYEARYRFDRFANPSMPSGEGLMVFSGNIPKNVAGTPAWDLVLHHVNASGSAGMVLLHISAETQPTGDTPDIPVVIVPNKLLGVGASGDENVSVMSSLAGVASFDAQLPVAASDRLVIIMRREPLGTSGDTLKGGWDLTLPPLLRIDVS
jgi:hypothetical protein